MKKIIDYETDFGYVCCNLKYLMDKKGISINMMSKLSKIKYDILVIVKELLFHDKKTRSTLIFKKKCTIC